MRIIARGAALALLSLAWVPVTQALDWSDSEFHFQYGRIDVPSFAGGGKPRQAIYMLQHAHGWKYGDNFFFLDALDSRSRDFQDSDFYGEWYSNFSLEGHIEYIGGRNNEFGGDLRGWLLAQPQLRWKVTGRLSLGIEVQFWMNKLGDGATDENTVLALFVWQF